MNVEIGTEAAAQFLEKEYINGIFLAAHLEQILYLLLKEKQN
jgi:hypothetical protein